MLHDYFLRTISLLLFYEVTTVLAAPQPGHHNALRQEEETITSTESTSTITEQLVAVPSASPIINAVSQGILSTELIPEYTICPLPQVRSPPAAGVFAYTNSSATSASKCSTQFYPVITPACHTVLTPLGGLPITVSNCSQYVTFSTDHGYTIVDNRTVVGLTTMYAAPWDEVVTGVPGGVVQAEVCGDGNCTTYQEYLRVQSSEVPVTATSTVDFTATVTGVSFSYLRESRDSELALTICVIAGRSHVRSNEYSLGTERCDYNSHH
jgi:hypothetical protein